MLINIEKENLGEELIVIQEQSKNIITEKIDIIPKNTNAFNK